MAVKDRLLDIDRAKGLAIILVVLGHIVARDFPEGHSWYRILKFDLLIHFHMQFFMFLSGVITFLTLNPCQKFNDYSAYAWKKFTRLAPAYFIFASVIFMTKVGLQPFIDIDNRVNSIAEFTHIILSPWDSPSRFLWYIYVLFEFYLIAPLLLKITNRLEFFLPFALILYFIPVPDLFALKQFTEHLFAFLLGGCAVTYYKEYTQLIDKWFYAFLAFFGATLLCALYVDIPSLFMGLVAIPALHGLVRRPWCENIKILYIFGQYTFAIYLMNTLGIGMIKAILLKFISWDGINFIWIGPLLFISGLCIPIIVKKFVFNRIPFLDRITA